MDRKVLFLDLDGTLTNDDKKVTPKTLKALKQIMALNDICLFFPQTSLRESFHVLLQSRPVPLTDIC